MALVNTQNLTAQARGFSALPVLRQIGLMVGLAASVALGTAIVLWSQTPSYGLLYGRLSDSETAQITEALDRAGIAYRIEQGSGAITVPSSKVHEARLKLATEGLPKGSDNGYELLEKDTGFGTSSFMEQARYQRAMEGELARSIATLQGVESARVHLAIPKRSVFVRDKSKPRASVVLNLYSGARLDDNRLAGIVNLVAASVPELEAEQITVVDQKGRLLTNNNGFREVALSASQLAYSHSLEELYMQRIHDILAPIVGEDGVRAQVVADVDFTVVEKTTENYQPEKKAVRSEETLEEKSTASAPSGVPGALSNQPPPGGTIDQAEALQAETNTLNSTQRATRNYEIDRSVSHTRSAPGGIRRLSVAVVVDYRTQVNDKGQMERVPLEAEELARVTSLVKEAVGFSADRNDSLNVSNISFKEVEQIEPLPEPPLWQEAWLWDFSKQLLGVVLVLLLAFGILRPVLQSLAARGGAAVAAAGDALTGGDSVGQLPLAEDRLSLSKQPSMSPLAQDQQFGVAKSLVENDPRRVAQVVKTWVASDG
jgi:flagellar M-ring protein FliF